MKVKYALFIVKFRFSIKYVPKELKNTFQKNEIA